MKTSSWNVAETDVRKIFGLITLFFCLTPWASWGTNSFDSQPWPLIFSSLYLVGSLRTLRMPTIYFVALIWCIGTVWVAIVISDPELEALMRATVSYITIPVVMIFFYNFCRKYGFPSKMIVVVNYIWIAFGVLEMLNADLTAWTSQTRTTPGRGVTSLAPEPTFFAVYLIFSSWLILQAHNYRLDKKHSFLIIVNFASILILAKSSMGIVFMGPLLLVWYIGRYGITFGLISFAAASGLILLIAISAMDLILYFADGTRIGIILDHLSHVGLIGLMDLDASINVRVEHVIVPVHTFLSNLALPGGFSGYAEASKPILDEYGNLFWYSGNSDKIMSWSGAILFETGFLGVFFVAILFYSCRSGNGVRIAELCVLLFLLFAAIPLAFSVVPLLLASFRFSKFEKQPRCNPNFKLSSNQSGVFDVSL